MWVFAMLVLLRHRAFVRFWLAGFFVVLSTWVLFITMQVMVFDLTGSPLATGLLVVFMSLPGVVLGPIAGVFVDRWDRKQVMATAALALAGLLLAALPLAIDASAMTLYAIIFLQGAIMAFYGPAENALLPTLVNEDDLAPANALNAMNDNFGNIIGPSVGALLYVQVGFTATLAACAILFLAGWAVIASIPATGRLAPPEATTAVGLRGATHSVLDDLRLGLRAVRARDVLLAAVAAFGLYTLADVHLTAVLPAFVGDSLGVGLEAFGLMMTMRGITGLLGGAVIAAVSRRVHEAKLLAGGLFVYGASISAWGVINTYALGLLITLPVGISAAAIQTGLFTLIQKASPPEMRGRVFGLAGTMNGVIGLSVSVAAGSLGAMAGTRVVVILSGCLQALPLLLVTTRLRPWRPRARRGSAVVE